MNEKNLTSQEVASQEALNGASTVIHRTATLLVDNWSGSYPWTYQITDDAIVDGCFVELWPVASSRNTARKADIYEDVTYSDGALVISATKKPTTNIRIKYTINR